MSSISARSRATGVLIAGILYALAGESSYADDSSSRQITSTEAEILVQAVPQIEELRAKHIEVLVGPASSDAWYYTFRVTGPSNPDGGSNLVGHFAVEKATAQVWDAGLEKEVSGPTLVAIQDILRREHGMSAKKKSRKYGEPGPRPS